MLRRTLGTQGNHFLDSTRKHFLTHPWHLPAYNLPPRPRTPELLPP